MKKLIYILFLLPLLAACSQDDASVTGADSGIIKLTASVAGIENVLTRADERTNEVDTAVTYTESTPSKETALEADIWLSTTSGQYKGNTHTDAGSDDDGIDAHRTIRYTGGEATSPSANGSNEYLHYPSTGATVYCVGLYPQSAWSTTDGTSVTATIDGVKDLMFAPQIEGSVSNLFSTVRYDDDNNPINQQRFSHLLTWIKLRVRAEDEEAVSTWGKLKSVTVKNSYSQANITLGNGFITYSGEYEAPLFTATAGDSLTITSEEKASVLVAPVTATDTDNEFTLHVKCDNYEKDVTVNLLDNDGAAYSGSTAGKLFVITLYFKSLKYIEGTVTLEDWEDEYTNLEMK